MGLIDNENIKKLSAEIDNKGFFVTSTEALINWARTGSLHWMTFGLACCAIEMFQTNGPRYDLERYGAAPRGSPRQSDVVMALTLPPILFAPKHPDKEKLSQYECGFEPFDDARTKFDIRFYLVAILFIIFDLEVAFLFPWAVVFGDIGLFGLFQ